MPEHEPDHFSEQQVDAILDSIPDLAGDVLGGLRRGFLGLPISQLSHYFTAISDGYLPEDLLEQDERAALGISSGGTAQWHFDVPCFDMAADDAASVSSVCTSALDVEYTEVDLSAPPCASGPDMPNVDPFSHVQQQSNFFEGSRLLEFVPDGLKPALSEHMLVEGHAAPIMQYIGAGTLVALVTGLTFAYHLIEDDVRKVFSRHGNVDRVYVGRKGTSALISFYEVEHAAAARRGLHQSLLTGLSGAALDVRFIHGGDMPVSTKVQRKRLMARSRRARDRQAVR